jgi:hypothetical protein
MGGPRWGSVREGATGTSLVIRSALTRHGHSYPGGLLCSQHHYKTFHFPNILISFQQHHDLGVYSASNRNEY